MYKKREIQRILQELSAYFDDPITKVTDLVGLTRQTVSKFFNDKPIKPSNSKKIYEASLQILRDRRVEIEQGKQQEPKPNPFRPHSIDS